MKASQEKITFWLRTHEKIDINNICQKKSISAQLLYIFLSENKNFLGKETKCTHLMQPTKNQVKKQYQSGLSTENMIAVRITLM